MQTWTLLRFSCRFTETKKRLQDVSLSALTYSKRIQQSWTHLFELLKLYTKKFDSYTLEMDDSNSVTDNTQLIFYRGINSPFHVHEELASLCRLNWPRYVYVTKSEGKYFLGIGLGKIDKCENHWYHKFVLVYLPSVA
jgi:hypothetical protein